MSKEIKVHLAKLEYQARIKEALRSCDTMFEIERPDLARLVKSYVNPVVYERRKKGYGKIIPDIVELMLSQENLTLTQSALLERIKLKHPNQKITLNIWHKKLQSYEKTAIKKVLIKNNMSEDLIKGCEKLSQLRKAVKIELSNQFEKKMSFNPKITVHPKKIVINGEIYPVIKRGKNNHRSISIRYKNKQVWLRVDALTKLLFQSVK